MKYFSIIILVCNLLIISGSINAKTSSTVPGEGGYGTITYEGITITGTFHRKYDWCRDCIYKDTLMPGVRVEGDLVKEFFSNGENFQLIPKSNSSVMFDDNRDLKFKGIFKLYDDGWDFYSGTIEYKGEEFITKTRGYIKAGNEVIEKYNAEQFAKKNKKEEKTNPSSDDYNNNDVIPASSGSGFIINNSGNIITNFHVVDSCEQVLVFKDGKKYNADVIAQDMVNDLGILNTNIKSQNFYSISSRNVFLLEDIIVAGYPLGKQVSSAIKTFEGSVSSLTGLGDNYSNFQIDANLNQGNSGGPIINFEGNVVGIAVAKIVEEGVEGFNFGIKSSVLKDFLDVNNITYSIGKEKQLSKKELSPKIVSSTVYIECWMTYANLKKIIEQEYSQKAFFRLN